MRQEGATEIAHVYRRSAPHPTPNAPRWWPKRPPREAPTGRGAPRPGRAPRARPRCRRWRRSWSTRRPRSPRRGTWPPAPDGLGHLHPKAGPDPRLRWQPVGDDEVRPRTLGLGREVLRGAEQLHLGVRAVLAQGEGERLGVHGGLYGYQDPRCGHPGSLGYGQGPCRSTRKEIVRRTRVAPPLSHAWTSPPSEEIGETPDLVEPPMRKVPRTPVEETFCRGI